TYRGAPGEPILISNPNYQQIRNIQKGFFLKYYNKPIHILHIREYFTTFASINGNHHLERCSSG
ncbi:MAG: hypothetical protein K2H16_04830, partial [Prevotella sp.]|nr:hypothetical protein [Prevotella sp.]